MHIRRLLRWGTVVVALWATIPLAAAQQGAPAAEKRYHELIAARDFAGALAEAQRLERTAKAQFGEQHLSTARALALQADVHYTQLQYGQAEELYRRVLAIREPVLGDSNELVAATLHGLGLRDPGATPLSRSRSPAQACLGDTRARARAGACFGRPFAVPCGPPLPPAVPLCRGGAALRTLGSGHREGARALQCRPSRGPDRARCRAAAGGARCPGGTRAQASH